MLFEKPSLLSELILGELQDLIKNSRTQVNILF